jgi:hypothetical protein
MSEGAAKKLPSKIAPSRSPEVFRNHRFPRQKPSGLSCLARQASQLVTAALLPGPNTSSAPTWTRAEPRQEKRGGSSLDGLGYVRLERIELQIELSRDSSQSDVAIKTRWRPPATARFARGSRIGGKVGRHGAASKQSCKRQLALGAGGRDRRYFAIGRARLVRKVNRCRPLAQLKEGRCPGI